MKFIKHSFCIFLLTILFATSCSKKAYDKMNHPEGVHRKVEFVLYSNKDFSGDNHIITFTVAIKTSSNQTLWDSVLAPMEIRNIPDFEHRIVIDKEVPYDDNSLKKVGFYYLIDDVGYSWHLDSIAPDNTFKVVEFNFQ